MQWVCTTVRAHAKGANLLHDVTEKSEIAFVHTDGSSGERYTVESVGAGLAVFDFDGDGDEDIYFLNGASLKGSKVDVAPKNRLYRNGGNWRFTDVTDQAGVGNTGPGLDKDVRQWRTHAEQAHIGGSPCGYEQVQAIDSDGLAHKKGPVPLGTDPWYQSF